MNNRNPKYTGMTLFVSPERLKADLEYIKRKYNDSTIHPYIEQLLKQHDDADKKLNGSIRP